MVEEGAIRPGSGRGRPSQVVSLAPQSGGAIGLDFGYRHVRGVIANLSHTILGVAERDLGVDYDPEVGLQAVAEIVDELMAVADRPKRLLGIAIGIPCPTDLNGVSTRSAIIPRWSGINVAEFFGPRFGLPIIVENESRLAAWGEKVWGAARNSQNFLYFKIHSGVGGAACVEGRLITGANGGAGEFGHISLDPNGPVCRCGNRGCLEAYSGIPAILTELSAIYPNLTLDRMQSLYEGNDPSTRRVVHDAAHKVGQAAAILCNAFNPDLIVIGGSLAPYGFLEQIQDVVARSTLQLNGKVDVQLGQLGRNASALGAAARAFHAVTIQI